MHERITEQELIEFLASERSIKPSKISMSSQLGRNLGVDGDDAVELMEAFAKRFNVNLTGYDHNVYFGPEAGLSIINLLFLSSSKKVRDLKPITVAHLFRCANDGSWHDT